MNRLSASSWIGCDAEIVRIWSRSAELRVAASTEPSNGLKSASALTRPRPWRAVESVLLWVQRPGS
jgi:hypothetical protein